MSATRPPSYDDRFVVPLEPSRRGAHRARMSPLIASLPIIAVVAVVVAVIALAWTLFGGTLLGGRDDTTSASTVTPQASETNSAPASASGPAQATETAPTTSASPVVEIDRTVSVTVLNSTRTSGLAKKATTELQGKGWTNAKFSYDSATSRTTSVVYYAKSSQKDIAQALVDDLGVGSAKQSSSMATKGTTVVLGTDYVS